MIHWKVVKRVNPKSSHHKEKFFFLYFFFFLFFLLCLFEKMDVIEPILVIISQHK